MYTTAYHPEENAKDLDFRKFENIGIVIEEVRCDAVAAKKSTANGGPIAIKLLSNDGRERLTSFIIPNETVQEPAKILQRRNASR